MFALILPHLSTTLWSNVFAQTPTKVILAAGFVAILVQSIKKFAPNLISGKIAIALNFAASLAAVFIGMDPAHFWSQTTLFQVMAVVLAAAGIHSTGKTLTDPGDPVTDPNLYPATSTGAMNSKSVAIALILSASLAALPAVMLTGCVHPGAATAQKPLPAGAVNQTDATTNQTLQSIHAFAASLTADVQSGKLVLTQPQRTALDRLNGALNVADPAEQAYHAAGGGDASILNATLAAVTAAFTQAQQAITPVAH